MDSRTLKLRREALTVLSDEDLQEAAAGATPTCLTPVTRLATLCYLCVLLTDVGC